MYVHSVSSDMLSLTYDIVQIPKLLDRLLELSTKVYSRNSTRFLSSDHAAVSYHTPNATSLVKPVIKKLSTKGPQENLRKFTSFRTRCMSPVSFSAI